MKLVSIIVPIYNVEEFIEACVESILNQTYHNIEVILVNDGSTDSSFDKIQKYINDPRIEIINQKNQGLGGARNTGLKQANGEYIVFVDSDDTIEPTMIEEMENLAEKKDLDIVCCDYARVNEKGKSLEVYKIPLEEDRLYIPNKDKEILLQDPSACNKMFRKDLFEKLNILFPTRVWYEDLRTTPKLLARATRVEIIHKPFYRYLQRGGSIMNSKTLQRQRESLEAMEDLFNYFKDNGLDQLYSKELEYLCIAHIFVYGINRLARISNSKNMITEFKNYTYSHFPNFHNNPYLSDFTSKERKFYDWIDHDQIWKIRLGDRIKREVKKWKKH